MEWTLKMRQINGNILEYCIQYSKKHVLWVSLIYFSWSISNWEKKTRKIPNGIMDGFSVQFWNRLRYLTLAETKAFFSKKEQTLFKDGNYGSHLRFQNRKIFAILNFHLAPMPQVSAQSELRFGRKCGLKILQFFTPKCLLLISSVVTV